MKDREFVELLNLYLDHEISAFDAARLEAEIQSNPHRRAIYRQYCRMQKACKLLAVEVPAAGKPAATAIPESWNGIRPAAVRSSGTGWRGALVGTGGLLAAACLIVVFQMKPGRLAGDRHHAGFGPPQTLAAESNVRIRSDTLASAQLQVMPEAPRAAVRTGSLMTNEAGPDGSPMALSFARTFGSGLRLATQSDEQLEWVRNFHLVSLAERNRVALPHFEPAPKSLRPDARAIRVSSPAEPLEESAAFRFQR